MEDPQGRDHTLAHLLATGPERLRDEIRLHLLQSALEVVSAMKPDKKKLVYRRLNGLVEKMPDDQDLLWHIVTSFMLKFREKPINVDRGNSDNRPDWMIFIDRPFPDRETSGIEYIVNSLMRAPAGKGGKYHVGPNGKRPVVRLSSIDQPLNSNNDEETGEITLHDLIEDDNAMDAIASSEERLARQQWMAKLQKFAPRCILAIRNLDPDKRYAQQRSLAIAFFELIISGRISDDEMDTIFSEKRERNETVYVVNVLALSKLFTKLGYPNSDKTAGKGYELVRDSLAAEISRAARGASDV